MKPLTTGWMLLLPAIILAVLSGGACQYTSSSYVYYEGTGPGRDSMQVVVGGWPIPYLWDMPYAFSPAGSVDFVGGLLGLDDFRVSAFLADVLIFWVLAGGLAYTAEKVRRNR